MTAYYNEIDPAAAAVLRHLIKLDVIAPGDVDTRSIKDVQPDDLAPYTQCHFFAGGGLWSVAARLAGWDDARPIWTGSCPCQPYSAAGKRGGADDPRHLWPDFHRLISARRPAVVVGEQVAGAAGYGWFDGVGTDLARENYASRSVDIPACAVDAPHQRNRLYWVGVAQSDSGRHERWSIFRSGESDSSHAERPYDQLGGSDGGGGRTSSMADPISGERDRRPIEPERGSKGRDAAIGPDAGSGQGPMVDASGLGWREGSADAEVQRGRPAASSADLWGRSGELGDAERPGLERHPGHGDDRWGSEPDRSVAAADGSGAAGELADTNIFELQGQPPTGKRKIHEQDDGVGRRNGSHWADAEWIICHDGKARRTKPGLRLLVDGLPGRVDLWRVGGNAIVPVEAAEVIKALMETL